jgi:hypothetical protein
MYKVIVDHKPSKSDNEIVKEGLIKSYEAQFGERDKEFSIFLKSDLGKVFGGIQAIFVQKRSISKHCGLRKISENKGMVKYC